jgi:hypothetical protein
VTWNRESRRNWMTDRMHKNPPEQLELRELRLCDFQAKD